MMKIRTRTARAHALAVFTGLALVLVATAALADKDPALGGVVNVNTATVAELMLLPGIGEARAQAVVAMRKQRGGFKSVDDLLQVKGIGEAGLERLRPHLTLTGPTTARAD